MTRKTKALIAILLAAIIGGGTAPLSKIGLKEIPPLTFATLRFLTASLLVFPFVYRQLPKNKTEILKICGASLFAALNISLYVFGIRLTGATMSQMIYSLTPVLTIVLSYFLLKEKMSLSKIGGIIFAFIGTIIITFLPIIEKSSALTGNLTGNLLILGGAISFSLYPVLSKQLQQRHSPFLLTSLFIFTTAIVHIPLAIIELFRYPQWWQTTSASAFGALSYVALFGTIFFYLLYQYGIKYGSPTVGSMILYLQPISVFIWSAPLLGEKLTTGLIIGGALTLTGAYLVTQAKN